MRVATLNLWMTGGDWPARRAVLRDGFRELRPDVIGFQEVRKDADHDTAREILDAEYEVRHQTSGLLSGTATARRSRLAGGSPAGTRSTCSSRRGPPTSPPRR